MKIQVVLIAVVVVYLATIKTARAASEPFSVSSFAPSNDDDYTAHQPEAFLEPEDAGLVRNKRQFGGYGRGGYRGYGGGGFRGGYGGGGYGGGFRRGGYGGYGGRSFGGGGFGYGR